MERRGLLKAAELCAQTFNVHYGDGESESIWIRTLTSSEYGEIDDKLAARRREVWSKYAEGSDRRVVLSNELESQSTSDLVAFLLMFEVQDIARKSRRRVPALMPFNPDKYTDEAARLKAEEEYKHREEEHQQMVKKTIEDLTAAKEKEFLSKQRGELLDLALRLTIRKAVNEDEGTLPEDYRILFAVYLGDDHSKRYFDSLDEVQSLPTSIKVDLLRAINEVDTVRPIDIKNSAGRSGQQIVPAENTLEPGTAPSTGDSQE